MNTKSIERITFFRPPNQMLRFYQFLLMTATYLPQQETKQGFCDNLQRSDGGESCGDGLDAGVMQASRPKPNGRTQRGQRLGPSRKLKSEC